MDRYIEIFAHLNGARLHYASPKTCHLKHFIVGDFLHLACIFDNARICGVNAIHIREDLAAVSLECTSQSNCRCI